MGDLGQRIDEVEWNIALVLEKEANGLLTHEQANEQIKWIRLSLFDEDERAGWM